LVQPCGVTGDLVIPAQAADERNGEHQQKNQLLRMDFLLMLTIHRYLCQGFPA